MKFRFCCTCEDEQLVKPPDNPEPRNTVLSTPVLAPPTAVITQQPKHVAEPIQLDRITEVSVEESSIQKVDDEQPPSMRHSILQNVPSVEVKPVQAPLTSEPCKTLDLSTTDPDSLEPSPQRVQELYNEFFNLLQAERAKAQNIPPPAREAPSISAETMIDGEKLTLVQMAPELFRCFFKGSNFFILEGDIYDTDKILDEADKRAIKVAYARVMEGIKLGAKELAIGVRALQSQGEEVWNPPPGSTINTDYVTRRGENAKMTFRAIGNGHFRSTYEGKQFTIVNSQLVENDGRFDEQDRELIIQTYKNTISGMQQGLQNMQQGLGFKRSVETLAYANSATFGTLATGRETLKRMRSLNHGKRISLLEEGLMAQPRQPVVLIEDITEQSKIPKYFDEVDGGKLAEPVLQKTTFTPHALTYDDAKTYEEQDKNELPLAKPLDEYIISMDENFNSENRYHFHKAKPRRVNRPTLNPKEKFRLASPERYSHFEDECLKLHNQYRKMHGVPPLVHNDFLAQVAKEWAEHLALKDAFYHRPNNDYRENLYYVEGMPCRAQMAVKAWYNEIDLYDYDNPKFSREVGHFTQLVWKDTREVGTGVAQIGDKVWVCCNYHPPGNYLDKLNDEFVPRPLIKRVKGT